MSTQQAAHQSDNLHVHWAYDGQCFLERWQTPVRETRIWFLIQRLKVFLYLVSLHRPLRRPLLPEKAGFSCSNDPILILVDEVIVVKESASVRPPGFLVKLM